MNKLIAVALVFALTATSIAQDAAKPYSEMSYEELLQVAPDTLNKTDKKAFRKAFKKAKYAEKKRLATEKKRLRAIEKARLKREKAIQKRLKKVHKYYSNTLLNRDEFSTNIEVAGPLIAPGMDWTNFFFGSKSRPKYALVAILTPTSEQTTIQMPVAIHTNIHGLSIPSLQILDITPAEYATLKNIWPNHHTAFLTGGTQRNVTIFSQETRECTAEECYFLEKFAIDLQLSDIVNAIERRTHLAVKVEAQNSPPLVVRIQYEYLLGFIERLSEADSRFFELGDMAANGREHIAKTTEN